MRLNDFLGFFAIARESPEGALIQLNPFRQGEWAESAVSCGKLSFFDFHASAIIEYLVQ